MTPSPDSLGGRNRRLLLTFLFVEQELCVCELEAAVGLAQPAVSRQLAVLQAAGWLSSRRDGRRIYYRVAAVPAWATLLLRAYADGGVPSAELTKARARLQRFEGRPVRITLGAS